MSEGSPQRRAGRFRLRLLAAMMLVVGGITALALGFAQRNVMAAGRRDLEQDFRRQLAAFHSLQDTRQAVFAERCRVLARRPRIHAALEDNALDLLYPSARDELATIMEDPGSAAGNPRAAFYRFLDERGAVLVPDSPQDLGDIGPREAALLSLPGLPPRAQTGYLWRPRGNDETLAEVIAMPIHSTESGHPIAALVLGHTPPDLRDAALPGGIVSGIWTGQRLHLPELGPAARAGLAARLASGPVLDDGPHSFDTQVGGVPSLIFYQRLNPGSSFPPAYEVSVYPLTRYLDRQRELRAQFITAGVILLAGAFLASRLVADRLAHPVEKLAVDSEENRRGRRRAETALRHTHQELERSARFSADASHQLKTPVAVLRAGLEQLLAEAALPPAAREEIGALVHQTFRLNNVIEDLLLLSRMDAGQLQLQRTPIDLIPLIEGWLDDMTALPNPHGLAFETALPARLGIEGEERYTSLILQNLLENARKYNRAGGRILITAQVSDRQVRLAIGNTGAGIAPAAQPQLFQRFHRGAAHEDLPGHGLGLNLARELARLHGGDLQLTRSGGDWTEFAVLFPLSPPPAGGTPP